MFRRTLSTQIVAASDKGAVMANAYVTWWGAVQLLAAGTALNQYVTANQIDVVRKDVECVKKDVERLQRDVGRIGDDVAEILRNQRRRWF